MLSEPSTVTSLRKLLGPTACPDLDLVCEILAELTEPSPVLSPIRKPIGTLIVHVRSVVYVEQSCENVVGVGYSCEIDSYLRAVNAVDVALRSQRPRVWTHGGLCLREISVFRGLTHSRRIESTSNPTDAREKTNQFELIGNESRWRNS